MAGLRGGLHPPWARSALCAPNLPSCVCATSAAYSAPLISVWFVEIILWNMSLNSYKLLWVPSWYIWVAVRLSVHSRTGLYLTAPLEASTAAFPLFHT